MSILYGHAYCLTNPILLPPALSYSEIHSLPRDLLDEEQRMRCIIVLNCGMCTCDKYLVLPQSPAAASSLVQCCPGASSCSQTRPSHQI